MPSKPTKCRHFDSTRQNLTGPVVGGACLGSSGLRFGSLGVTWALQDTRFGSSGPTRIIQWCTLLHWDLDFTQQGSLGLKFGSLRLTGTQIWLIRAHWRSSGPRFGSSTLNGTQIRLIQLILTHIWFIEAQSLGHTDTGTQIKLIGAEQDSNLDH